MMPHRPFAAAILASRSPRYAVRLERLNPSGTGGDWLDRQWAERDRQQDARNLQRAAVFRETLKARARLGLGE